MELLIRGYDAHGTRPVFRGEVSPKKARKLLELIALSSTGELEIHVEVESVQSFMERVQLALVFYG